MVAQVHGNALGALQFEINRTPNDVYTRKHVARLKNENPGFIHLVEILKTHASKELSPEVAEAFEQYALYLYRSIELSELLPDPQVALEQRCTGEMHEVLTRIIKSR